jgi:hypothetical protein
MKSHIATGAALCALTIGLTAAPAFAKEPAPRPMYARIARDPAKVKQNTALTTWKFDYKYNGKSYSPSFVGTDPSKGAVSTVTPVVIIPVELSFDGFKTNPNAKISGIGSVTQNVVASPIFSSGYDFQTDKTDIGSVQYVDAFQKMSLWGVGGNATGYQVTLGAPTIEKLLKLKVPAQYGQIGSFNGIKVLEANINWFDQQINAQITKLKIPQNTFPIFLTTQTYLTSGGCCIGGYHSESNGGVTYAHATYIVNTGANVTFAQDVAALSHEVSEWYDDPFVNNNSPCGIYEVGDPLEREANYGAYPYTLGGFTFHLQDEATPVYFGAPTSTTLGGYATFVGTKVGVCANGS